MVNTPHSSAPDRLQIVSVASECAPFAKVGGLGDVVAALPKALVKLGHECRVVIPLYASIDRAKHKIEFDRMCMVQMGNHERQEVGVFRGSIDGVRVWFVDYARFYNRPGIYDEPSGEYKDNAYRFALLSKAAMQICKDEEFVPDVMHAHDWPSALVPAFLKTWDRVDSPLSQTASVLTIHNIGYQGVYDASVYPYIGIGREHFTLDKFEEYGRVNLLKAGIAFADIITTVSPTHAREIGNPSGGMGLAKQINMRKNDLVGILNGADYDHWNPETDPLIPSRYSVKNTMGKAVCKSALQKRFNLAHRADLPVFGIVSRFYQQKGIGLLMDALPRALKNMAFQLVVLGTGDRNAENFFRGLSGQYPDRVGCHIGFDNELSHLIEAGSDFFLMPSLYEPCGLNQMYSMKYGTLPLVRSTGGLEDTVRNFDERTGAGNGFKFYEPVGLALYNTIGWALSIWFDRPGHITQLRESAMKENFSWDNAAERYVEVYRRAIQKRRG